MANFIQTQLDATMQEIKAINAQFKLTREALEAAEKRNDEHSATFWKNQERILCDKADEVWGLYCLIEEYQKKTVKH